THLIMVVSQIAEFDARVGGDLSGLAVTPQIGNVNGEVIGPHGRDRPQPRLVPVDCRQIGKTVGLENGQRLLPRFSGRDCQLVRWVPRCSPPWNPSRNWSRITQNSRASVANPS